MRIDKTVIELEWDEDNIKHIKKHTVEWMECEEIFFDTHKVIVKDILHSQNEERCIVLGKTKKGRLLYTVFTKRGKKIRIISSRDINKKEVHLYEKED